MQNTISVVDILTKICCLFKFHCGIEHFTYKVDNGCFSIIIILLCMYMRGSKTVILYNVWVLSVDIFCFLTAESNTNVIFLRMWTLCIYFARYHFYEKKTKKTAIFLAGDSP